MAKTPTATRRVALGDLLSGHEAAALAGITFSNLRVKLGQSRFPLPVRDRPKLWVRQDVEDWMRSKG